MHIPASKKQRDDEYTQEGGDMVSQAPASPRHEVPRKSYNDPEYRRASDFDFVLSSFPNSSRVEDTYPAGSRHRYSDAIDANVALMRDLI